ncbi:peptide ABC transporter substrate-binding protein, partial [Candidatus Uhrbacteria bacterium]|nr:peptide ABC transporter substrate-binding protein [Candidatus Uhrbacteria bacterium]
MSFIHTSLSRLRKLWPALTNLIRRKKPGPGLEQKLVLRVKQPHLFPTPGQLRYLPRLLSKTERLIFRGASFLGLVSFLALLLLTLNYFRIPAPAGGGTYIEAVVGQPKLINPLWADANDVDRDLVGLIFTGLFRSTASLSLEPDLAEQFIVSEDGKTYTVTLRERLRWHDQTPLTANDVVFTVKAIKNPAYQSPRANDFQGVTASASDERTVVFQLERPSASFLSSLTVGIIPEHLWADVPPENARLAELNIKPVGAGPYRFDTLKKTRQGAIYSVHLKSNSRFHRPTPLISNVVFRFFSDTQSAAQALADRKVGGVAFLSRPERQGLTSRTHLGYYRLELPQITALFLNQKRNAALGERSVRLALAGAIDKPNLISQTFGGEATLLDGPFLPWFPGYAEAGATYPFDTSRAASLLDESGFRLKEGATVRAFVPKDKKDKRFSPDTELKISLTTVDIPEYVKSGELIRDAWQGLGISTELIILDPKTIDRQIIPQREYDTLLYGEILGADPDPFPFWHSSQINPPGVNLSGYSNRRVDALLEEGRLLTDPAERAKRYQEFQTIIGEDLPAIFLFAPSYTY